ncbi:hypothetical protein [Camelimonas lactis]|uniref:GIY-YIG catalytic domain-containing protein n=1 Tax=Camelimonas lactis TaxID=659006 RepID=A0A4R2GXB0_9HYPH|nr:hypothetical protein [Camelimonas lactis]TCO15862.1 hypothetical protein EV666_101111 [Camelimonas lactis]
MLEFGENTLEEIAKNASRSFAEKSRALGAIRGTRYERRDFPIGIGESHDGEFDYKLRQGISEVTRGFYWMTLKSGSYQAVRDDFLKNKKPDIAYSKLNAFGDNKALYVGRSSNLLGRIKQHIIGGPKATYAMHMSTWAYDLEGLVQIHAAAYPDAEDDVLQALEDALWDELTPLFGKRGPR